MGQVAYLFLEEERRIIRCDLTQELTVIGSGETSDFRLMGSSIHGVHAQVVRVEDVFLLRAIEDAEVFVNGSVLVGPYELQNGDRIQLADEDILFARSQVVSPTTVCLMVRRPDQMEFGFWMSKSTIAIGGERGDLVVRNAGFAPIHAVIENYCAHGQFVVVADPTHRSLLNGKPIQGRMRVSSGDLLQFGDAEIRIRIGTSVREAITDSRESKQRLPRFASDRLAKTGRRRVHSAHDRRESMSSVRAKRRDGDGPQRPVQVRGSGKANDVPLRSGWSEELWYLPGRRSMSKRRLPRPIIRARGDRPPSSLPDTTGATIDTDVGTMVRDVSMQDKGRAAHSSGSAQEVEQTPTQDTDARVLKDRVSSLLQNSAMDPDDSSEFPSGLTQELRPSDA
jgi:pSer/pThr/pTyr-binding forkhead associated (FHA) protein